MRQLWRRSFVWWQGQFGRLGRLVGNRPLASLTVSCLLAGLCCLGFLNAKIVQQLDELWVPSNSQTVQDEHRYQELFPSQPFSRVERIMVVPKDFGVDMLQRDILAQVFDLRHRIYNLTVVAGASHRGNYMGGRVGLLDLCPRILKGAACVSFDPLGYWGNGTDTPQLAYMQSRTPTQLHEDANLLLISGTIPVQQRVVLGCIVKTASGLFLGDTVVSRVGALIFTFFIDTSAASVATIENWEKELLHFLDTVHYPDIVAYASTGVSTAEEISRQSTGDVLLLVLVYGIMAVYMVLALTSFTPVLRTRCLLGLGAVATVALGIAASLGFTALFFNFNPLTVQVLPFVMLSIGMDSVFILFTHFHNSLRSLPSPEPQKHDLALALEDAMQRQGASVALTALTKAIGFVGPVIVLRIPALQQFCVVVAVSICFEVILAFLMFCPLLMLDAMREIGRRADLLPCIRLPRVEAVKEDGLSGTPPFSLSAAEGAEEGSGCAVEAAAPASSTAIPLTLPAGSPGPVEGECSVDGHPGGSLAGEPCPLGKLEPGVEAGRGGCRSGSLSPGLLDLDREMGAQRSSPVGRFLAGVYIPRFVASPLGQLLVYAAFGGLLAAGIVGCVTINESLNVRSLVTEGTQLYHYLSYEEKCDTHIGPPVFIVTEQADYASPQTSVAVGELVSSVYKSPYIEPNSIFSWYSDFTTKFLPYSNWTSELDSSGWPRSPGVFYAALDDFLHSFAGVTYSSNLVVERSPSGSSSSNSSGPIVAVRASRIQGLFLPLNTTAEYVGAMRDIRRRVAAVPQVQPFTDSYFYVFYEQFLSIVGQYVLMLALTVAAIFLVTLAFMGPKTAAVVAGVVLMIHVDMLGICSYLGVSLNAVSAVNAVAIMGLADEYVNYIMRAFELEDGTPEERIESALLQYMRPVSNAAVSTILGVVPLAFARSALYRVYYFRMFLVATVLSWLSGAVLLPVLLLSTHGVGLGSLLWRCGSHDPRQPTAA